MNVRAPIEPSQPGGYPPGPGRPSPSSGDDGRGPWPVILVLASVVAAVGLVAGAIVFTRGDSAEEVPLGGPVTSAGAAPAAAPTTVDPQAATKAEVIAAYRAAFDEQMAVGRDPQATADDDRLRAHRTGDALTTMQGAMLKHKSRGAVYVGEIKLHPRVVELGAGVATVSDCIDDAVGTVDATTREVVEPATRLVTTVTVTMKLVNGVWKMSNFRDEKVPCTPPAS